MQKLQILFPEPLMQKMRMTAEREDISVSDLVRRATDHWLARFPTGHRDQRREMPVVDAGRCLVDAQQMKEILHE